MNEKQLSKSFVIGQQTQTTSVQSQRSATANPASMRPPLAVGQRGRTSPAPAQSRTPSVPKVMQAKMDDSPQTSHHRPLMNASSGVVQANVIGGNHALQARLKIWNGGATRGSNQNTHQAIQRKTGAGVEAFRVPLREKSGGHPLPDAVRAKMEAAFKTDFSDVRVHVGREASSLGAIAFTWGTNIHFAPGQYNPNTLQGQKLLGHELWHVVQQKNGRVKNPFGGGVAVVQDYALEAEADRMGIKAALTQVTRKSDK